MVDDAVVITGLVMGAVGILCACWVWLRHREFGAAGALLCLTGVVLMGLSVWKNVKIRAGEYEAELERLDDQRDDASAAIAALSERLETTREQLLELIEALEPTEAAERSRLEAIAGSVRRLEVREPEGLERLMAASVWGSPEGCRKILEAGGRRPWRAPAEPTLKLATWNLRWFPRGCPEGSSCPDSATDVDWLACTIAWMDLDLLAVQEILDTPDGRQQMGSLRQELDRLTDGRWEADLQECGGSGAQKVGFLWDATRLTLEELTDACQLNGATRGADCPNPCAENLRPGRYARAESTRQGGSDFHLVSVHLDSGRRDRDFEHRRIAVERIPDLSIDGVPVLTGDRDLLVAGDFNTMGRSEPPAISADEEIARLDESLGAGFRRLVSDLECSSYFRGHGGLLDHVVASRSMEEVDAQARLSGYCAVAECEALTVGEPPAYRVLSDHCPVLFAVRDEDLDGT